LAEIGCDEADLGAVQQAAEAPAWQVRKAAVLSLSRWADSEAAARDALSVALKDDDADVRAYARRALEYQPA
jgi:HEAT repeat protein